jgi:hypothetical protein
MWEHLLEELGGLTVEQRVESADLEVLCKELVPNV